jgi:hypothetical protein
MAQSFYDFMQLCSKSPSDIEDDFNNTKDQLSSIAFCDFNEEVISESIGILYNLELILNKRKNIDVNSEEYINILEEMFIFTSEVSDFFEQIYDQTE